MISAPWGINLAAVDMQAYDAERALAAAYLESPRGVTRARTVFRCARRCCAEVSFTAWSATRSRKGLISWSGSHEQRGPVPASIGSMVTLLHHGLAPILVVPPSINHASPQHAIIPLDGPTGAELALTLLSHLTRTAVGEVTLLRVVRGPDEVVDAHRYLSSVAGRPELAHLSSQLRVGVAGNLARASSSSAGRVSRADETAALDAASLAGGIDCRACSPGRPVGSAHRAAGHIHRGWVVTSRHRNCPPRPGRYVYPCDFTLRVGRCDAGHTTPERPIGA